MKAKAKETLGDLKNPIEKNRSPIMETIIENAKQETEVTKMNFEQIVDSIKNADTEPGHYKRIRVMVKDIKPFSLNKGDFLAVREINVVDTPTTAGMTNYAKKAIFFEVDIGNINQPLAPIQEHFACHFTPTKFAQIWNNSVELDVC